jgi:hypothetical protein
VSVKVSVSGFHRILINLNRHQRLADSETIPSCRTLNRPPHSYLHITTHSWPSLVV